MVGKSGCILKWMHGAPSQARGLISMGFFIYNFYHSQKLFLLFCLFVVVVFGGVEGLGWC